MNKIDTKSLVFSWLGKPTPVEIVPLSLQHVAAMVVGCVTPAIIVSNICGLSPADSVILIQSALIISGLATLSTAFPHLRKSRLWTAGHYGRQLCLSSHPYQHRQ